ncbi:MAG: hypothetical protein K5665_04070 [Saccharofermentans sp.]|nr:hypothetical protein [Saccharofermentans sp.]
MKSILRKVTSICIATVMVAAMGLTSLATELNGTGGKVGDNDPATALDNYIVIYKEITAYNPDSSTVNAPNITYNYAIAPGTAGKIITDDTTPDSVTAQTKAGPAAAVSLSASSISWTNADTLTTSAGGTANTKTLQINVDPTAFSGPGVYRYVITETVGGGLTKAACGVIDGGISDTRYLDIYVRDPKTGEAAGLKVYGYVLFQNDNDINAKAAATAADAEAKAGKTEGFVATTDPADTTNTLTADAYYTYNLKVGKTLVNDSGNTANQFPFTVTFTNGTITQNIDLISDVSDSSKATLAEVAAATITSLATTPTIADGAYVTYTGIPCGTAVTIYETNNVATAAYTSVGEITVGKLTGDADAASKLINVNVASNNVEIVAGAADAAGTSREVTFTNTFALISPTGVAMAVLPFVIMLVFGLGFMAVATKKKADEQA